jgi:ribosomal protein S18 acetylase RimI-like enzyme
MSRIEIVDVGDEARFGLIPPCADPSFDHRTCDYWEDADHGSKASRPGWLKAGHAAAGPGGVPHSGPSANPFAPPKANANPFLAAARPDSNPFVSASAGPVRNPFLDDLPDSPDDNPLAPTRPARPTIAAEAPRKLQLLGRGLGVFGTYAKLLLVDGEAAGYCQFGPLSAYPRALRLRELYSQLPDAPLPAVITCIATTAEARRSGHALRLVAEVCRDLTGRGFAAVEAYPETRAAEDATPAARPEFWILAGFLLAVDDEHYPVVRREL